MEIHDEATLRVWEQYVIAIEVTSHGFTGNYSHLVTVLCADRAEAQQVADKITLVMRAQSDITWVGDPAITFLNTLDPVAIERKIVLTSDAPSRRIRTGRKR